VAAATASVMVRAELSLASKSHIRAQFEFIPQLGFAQRSIASSFSNSWSAGGPTSN